MPSRLKALRAFAASGNSGFRDDVRFLLDEIAKRDQLIAALTKEKKPPKLLRRPPVFRHEVDVIVKTVSIHFGIEHEAIYGKDRWKRTASARHAAMLIARQTLALSYPELGAALGGRDHSTVMAGCARARKLRETDQWFRAAIEAAERALRPAEGQAA